MGPELLAQLWLPPGTPTQLAQRNGTFVGWLLDTAEANYRRGAPALPLVYAVGGGLDCHYIQGSGVDLILFGEVDLRLRALQYDTLNSLLRHELTTEELAPIQSRLSAELCRYRAPDLVPALLAACESSVAPPTWASLDTAERDERYVGLWSLPVLHEAGHWFAARMIEDDDGLKASELRARQDLERVLVRLRMDPQTRPWTEFFDADAVRTAELVEEGLADAMMVDVFFEVWMKHFGEVDWGVLVEPTTISLDLAHMFVGPVVDQLIVWHLSIEWRVHLEAALGIWTSEEACRRLVLLELRREAMMRDLALYLADEARLGAVEYEYESLRENIDEVSAARVAAVREPLMEAARSMTPTARRDLEPPVEVVESYFDEMVPPSSDVLKSLIETTGARPHFVPTE